MYQKALERGYDAEGERYHWLYNELLCRVQRLREALLHCNAMKNLDIIGDYEEKTTLLHSGLHIKYMKSSSRQQYLKRKANRKARKYCGLSGKGNRYRKVFDYWWELY